jgi:amidohydrolase
MSAVGSTAENTSGKARLRRQLDDWAGEVLALSHSLHAEPELSFAEHRSCAKVSALMERAGFSVQTPVASLETALVATAGTGDLVVGLCAEYDALPGIGHACGHNVNGAASVGAALALAPVADELGLTVRLIGTPGEETDGGKVDLLGAGVFDDVALAMMVHAGGADETGLSSYALSQWDVNYTGAPAHAASAPWHGRNALDALVLAYQAIGLLRQQLQPGSVVSFVMDGAAAATNVIPATARGRIEMRTSTSADLASLEAAVRRCLEAGAHATATTLDLTPVGNTFAELRQDEDLTRLYRRAITELGRAPHDGAGAPAASTDMGNVSHVIPSLHPVIGYDVAGAAHHTPAFALHGVTPSADRAVLDGALALAQVAHDAATEPRLRQRLLEAVARRTREGCRQD